MTDEKKTLASRDFGLNLIGFQKKDKNN